MCELDRQVMEADSTKDLDTSVDLVRAVMLPNNVSALSEKTLEMLGSLLVINTFR